MRAEHFLAEQWAVGWVGHQIMTLQVQSPARPDQARPDPANRNWLTGNQIKVELLSGDRITIRLFHFSTLFPVTPHYYVIKISTPTLTLPALRWPGSSPPGCWRPAQSDQLLMPQSRISRVFLLHIWYLYSRKVFVIYSESFKKSSSGCIADTGTHHRSHPPPVTSPVGSLPCLWVTKPS